MAITLESNPIFESFWRFAAERQSIYEQRILGLPEPWTEDTILATYKFTNPYRAADRVSQYLIRNVIYFGDQSYDEVVFRTLLFKIFNRIDTWEMILREIGFPCLSQFDVARYGDLLSEARSSGRCIYSNAYIVPPVPRSSPRKHEGHLQLIGTMIEDGLSERIRNSNGLEDVVLELSRYPGLGAFLSYQFAIDLNYSAVCDHDENDFVQPGPGALDGISKVSPDAHTTCPVQIIQRFTREQEKWFNFYGLRFNGLFGRSLHLIDIQNLFCEISKYSRVAFPTVMGASGRTRIKQRFEPSGPLPIPFFPPKWSIEIPAETQPMKSAARSPI